MYASTQFHAHPVSPSTAIRWFARISAAVLIVGWISFAVAELFHPDFYVPRSLLYQGAALAAVFAGYAVGWRWELVGGLLAIAGARGALFQLPGKRSALGM